MLQAADIKQILAIDTETTGLTDEDETIEVACSLYNIEHNASIASYSALIKVDHNECEEINNISVGMLSEGLLPEAVWSQVLFLAKMADVIVAHRADFDSRFVPEYLAKLKPWSCSKMDMQWPKSKPERGEHLVHLALAHDVSVYTAHRAMADVDTLVRTFQAAHRMGHDIAEMIAQSMRPKGLYVALVSYNDREIAKNAGFKWGGDKDKRWLRTMFLDEAKLLPFKTKQVAK